MWGTDVHTAVGLESNGIPGEVCVSENVAKYLQGHFEFRRHTTFKLKAKAKDGTEEVTSFQLIRPGQPALADTPLAPPAPAAAVPAPAPTVATTAASGVLERAPTVKFSATLACPLAVAAAPAASVASTPPSPLPPSLPSARPPSVALRLPRTQPLCGTPT